MDFFLETINKTNESMSIYRALVITKDENETNDIFDLLKQHEYPVATNFDCLDTTRIIVLSCQDFVEKTNYINFDEITVIYSTSFKIVPTVSNILDMLNVKLCTLIVMQNDGS